MEAPPEPPAEPARAAPPARQVRAPDWRKLALMLPLYLLARLWIATLRVRATPEVAAHIALPEQVVVMFWHNRLFIISELYRRYRARRRMIGLVSASGDGAWLAAFFRLAGIGAVRGSSSWRGMQALRELQAVMREGADIAVTPDGPRGPRYSVAPGALLVARLARCPLLLISARFASAWRLKSWDGFFLPKPFSTVELRARVLPGYADLGADGDDTAAAAAVRAQLLDITQDGD